MDICIMNERKLKDVVLVVVICLCTLTAITENDFYWVFLKDKKGVTFDPYSFFDAKAIERRLKLNVSLYDTTDFPVSDKYIQKTEHIVTSIEGKSRWLNALFVEATADQVNELKQEPYVLEVVAPQYSIANLARKENLTYEVYDVDSMIWDKQITHMEGNHFIENGITGKGIRIAIFDAGFPSVDTHPAFEHIRKSNRIIKTYDFTKNKEHVYAYSSHGTTVLSCIAGVYEGKHIGLATGAEFLLARTELSLREPYSEEKNWLMAAEWADKNGADIINSSLGYTEERYFTRDMDGKKSLVSRAARMAVRKGILVVNAAGNSGMDTWKIIGAPADVDSVLTVGGIDPYTNFHIDFSSYGPNAKTQMKPNVCAFGQVLAAEKEGLEESFGTSFSTPLVVGFAACAWQVKRKLTNMQLFKEIEQSGHLYPYFDYAHGFGIPKASYFVGKSVDSTFGAATFDVVENEKAFKVNIKEAYLDTIKSNMVSSNMDQLFEELVDEVYDAEYFYYHIENNQGYIRNYFVVKVVNPNVVSIPKYFLNEGEKIRFHYKGYSKEIKI